MSVEEAKSDSNVQRRQDGDRCQVTLSTADYQWRISCSGASSALSARADVPKTTEHNPDKPILGLYIVRFLNNLTRKYRS